MTLGGLEDEGCSTVLEALALNCSCSLAFHAAHINRLTCCTWCGSPFCMACAIWSRLTYRLNMK